MIPYDVLRVLSLVVVWAIPAILVLGVVAFVVLAPAFAFGGAARRLYDNGKKTKLQRHTSPAFTCSIDTDCPPGYVCVGGRCIPENVA